MEIGIVGLPNVGKSSLFNALTGASAQAENFPFTTIEPNVGIVPLSDPRLDFLADKHASQKKVPAGIRFVDIAGIVQGASKGEGLGNKFLSNIRSVDAITHVIRCFKNDDVVNVLGDLDPNHAAEVIETELMLADLEQAERAIEKWTKGVRRGDKESIKKTEGLKKVIEGLNNGQSIRVQNVDPELVQEYQFLTAKPILYVANTDEDGAPEEIISVLKERATREGAGLVELCTKLEAEIVQMDEAERADFYEAAGITTPGLAKLAKAGCDLLNLVCFFTSGPEESRAWLVEKGTVASKAAGKIHTDIERGFIRAEVYKFDQFKEHGSEKTLQEKGLINLEGKEYKIQDGDVVYFRFNV